MNKISYENIFCYLSICFILLFSITSAYADRFTIPSWINNIAEYRIDGHTSDEEFVNALQYLLDQNIIRSSFNTQIEVKDIPYPFVTIQMNKTQFKTDESVQIVIKNIGMKNAFFNTMTIINDNRESVFSAGHGIPEEHWIMKNDEKKTIQLKSQNIQNIGQYKIFIQYSVENSDGCCSYITERTFRVNNSSNTESILIKKFTDGLNNGITSYIALSDTIEGMIKEKIIDSSRWIKHYQVTNIEPILIVTKDKIKYKTGDTVEIMLENKGSTDIIFDNPSIYVNHETCCYDGIQVLKSGKKTIEKFAIPHNEYSQEKKRIVFAYHSPYEQENHFIFLNIIADP